MSNEPQLEKVHGVTEPLGIDLTISERSEPFPLDREVRVDEIRAIDPKILEAQADNTLFSILRNGDKARIEIEYQLGQIVAEIYRRHHPKKQHEWEAMLWKKAGLHYKKAMALREFYLAYAANPNEITEYPPTAAHLLARHPAATDRAEVWSQTGTVEALRQFYRRDHTKGTQRNKTKAVVLNEWIPRTVAPGVVAEYSGMGVQMWIFDPAWSTKKLEKAISRMVGVRVTIPKKPRESSAVAIPGENQSVPVVKEGEIKATDGGKAPG